MLGAQLMRYEAFGSNTSLESQNIEIWDLCSIGDGVSHLTSVSPNRLQNY